MRSCSWSQVSRWTTARRSQRSRAASMGCCRGTAVWNGSLSPAKARAPWTHFISCLAGSRLRCRLCESSGWTRIWLACPISLIALVIAGRMCSNGSTGNATVIRRSRRRRAAPEPSSQAPSGRRSSRPLRHSPETQRNLVARIPSVTGRDLRQWFARIESGPAFLRAEELADWLSDEYGLSQLYAFAIVDEYALRQRSDPSTTEQTTQKRP